MFLVLTQQSTTNIYLIRLFIHILKPSMNLAYPSKYLSFHLVSYVFSCSGGIKGGLAVSREFHRVLTLPKSFRFTLVWSNTVVWFVCFKYAGSVDLSGPTISPFFFHKSKTLTTSDSMLPFSNMRCRVLGRLDKGFDTFNKEKYTQKNIRKRKYFDEFISKCHLN